MSPPTSQAEDHLSSLVNRLHLPPHIANLARSILQATTSHPPDPYTSACAVYIASSSHSQSQVSLSSLLNAPGSQLRIPHFFDTAKGLAADAAASLPTHSDPTRIVHLSHRAFMVCADVWRKLRQLVDTDLIRQTPDTLRLAWLFFLVCKAHLSSPTDSALAPVSAFHLMLACLIESGLVAVDSPVKAVSSHTEAVPAEISRFRQSLKAALPPMLREKLPFYSPDAHIPDICKQLTSEYEALLFSVRHRHATDERVFIESPHLLLSPTSDSEPILHEPVTPTRSPRKRPRDLDKFQTPQKRPNLLRDRMPVTPNHFARHAASPRADDPLDALAAVACSTPRSAVRPPRIPYVPSTPMTAGCAAVSWLHKLADTRQETHDPSILDCASKEVKPSKELEAVIDNGSLWQDLVTSVRTLSNRLCEVMPELNTAQRRREAMAVYVAAIEGILTREASRLAKEREKFSEKLLKNGIFHKSILTCSWEVTAAAYGRRDMAVFSAAMKTFGLSAFALTKAVESFVLRLPSMPRSLSKHILTCEARILESLAWRADSELVLALKERSLVRSKEGAKARARSGKSAPPPRNETSAAKSESKQEANSKVVHDFALELFYKKMLSVASDRVQELLIMLRMDAIVEPVWSCIKHSVWEKWHLMVDRHLDQIIMCCIYGVSKVRRYQLKFKEIISTYRKMSHTREPSFSHLVPSVFRDLPIDLNQESPSNGDSLTEKEYRQPRGDIIKFYNQVFINSMKAYLLKFQVNAPQTDKNSVGNPGRSGTTIVDSQLQSSSEFPVSLTNSQRTTAGQLSQSAIMKDRLSDKVMSSPLRVLRPHASPKRIGRVTVSPMSPGGRLAVLRQSPGRKSAILGSMTPGTRTLYAFGESPVRNLDRINRSLSNETGRLRRPVPLNFEGRNAQVRSESIRRRYADVLGMTGIRANSTRLAAGVGSKQANESESDSQGLRTSSASETK